MGCRFPPPHVWILSAHIILIPVADWWNLENVHKFGLLWHYSSNDLEQMKTTVFMDQKSHFDGHKIITCGCCLIVAFWDKALDYSYEWNSTQMDLNSIIDGPEQHHWTTSFMHQNCNIDELGLIYLNYHTNGPDKNYHYCIYGPEQVVVWLFLPWGNALDCIYWPDQPH